MSSIVSDLFSILNDFGYNLVQFLIGWIYIPQVPDSIKKSVFDFLSLFFEKAHLLGFFVNLKLVVILLPFVIIIINFQWIYNRNYVCIEENTGY